jgi:hypothetical protein
MTNAVWLQDTDWNANGFVDREEEIRWSSASTKIGDNYEMGDLDLDGVSDTEDEDPVFDNGDEALERDVMAYAPVEFLCVQLGMADDVDGTIDDSTKIYSMAGAADSRPTITIDEIEQMCRTAGFRAVERDTHYNEIKR